MNGRVYSNILKYDISVTVKKSKDCIKVDAYTNDGDAITKLANGFEIDWVDFLIEQAVDELVKEIKK